MGARIGFVSSYDAGTGMASVYYPARSGDTSAMMPVFTPFGSCQKLEKGDMVLVIKLDDGSSVIIGSFSGGDAAPAAQVIVSSGNMTLKDNSGSVTVAKIIQAVSKMHDQGTG